MNLRNSLFLILVAAISFAAETPQNEWDKWLQNSSTDTPAVQNKKVEKAGRIEWLALSVGTSERHDFYSNYFLSTAVRYHFAENHSWEVVRATFSNPKLTDVATEVNQQTNYHPDSQPSWFQMSTSYIYRPIYGKYSWGTDSIVYFDTYFLAGAGLRWAKDRQPFVQTGLGMSHYLFSERLAVIPEIRVRLYEENRSEKTLVSEVLFQLGFSWLF